MRTENIECPRCRANGLPPGQCELRQRPVKGTSIVIDWCSRCKGIWFDARELEQSIVGAERHLERPQDALAGGLGCPVGHGPMWSFRYPGTLATIDLCGECLGVWLEGGQFEEIKVVRAHLHDQEQKRKDEGVRGKLCDWVDAKIDELTAGW